METKDKSYTVVKENVDKFEEGKYYVCRETERPWLWNYDGEMDAHLDGKPRKALFSGAHGRFEGIDNYWSYNLSSQHFDEVELVELAELPDSSENTSKFKVGDKVKVVSNENFHSFKIGEILEIIEYDEEDNDYECINSSGHTQYLIADEFVKVESKGNYRKFKVNDKLKVIDELHGHGFEDGDEITVFEIDEGYDSDGLYYKCKYKDGGEWWLSEEEVELIDSKESEESNDQDEQNQKDEQNEHGFKVGDRVIIRNSFMVKDGSIATIKELDVGIFGGGVYAVVDNNTEKDHGGYDKYGKGSFWFSYSGIEKLKEGQESQEDEQDRSEQPDKPVFKIGDKVRLISAQVQDQTIGDVGTVIGVDSFGDPEVEYEYGELYETKDTVELFNSGNRIDILEKEITDKQKELDELKSSLGLSDETSEPEKPSKTYRIGQRFVGGLGSDYILAKTQDSHAALINLDTGNLWSYNVIVNDKHDITQEEFDKISDFDYFEELELKGADNE